MESDSNLTEKQHPELLSLIVFGFNQAGLIHEAILAAFAQTYQPLEIVLSDNGSDDETFAVMEKLARAYDGPHTVRLNRNSENRGFIGHVNQAFDLCRGVLIVYNPGDDVSLPERAGELYNAFRHDRPLLVHSDAFKMTADGTVMDEIFSQKARLDSMDLEAFAKSQGLVIGATCAWNPDMFRIFGPITYEKTFDDLVLAFRARLVDRIAYVEKPLVNYRFGDGLSKTSACTRGEALAALQNDTVRAIEVYRQRRDDCQRVTPENQALIAKLDDHIRQTELKLRLYQGKPIAILSAFTSLAGFTATASAFNTLRKLGSQRRLEKRARHIQGHK